jgi:hypothetical protein
VNESGKALRGFFFFKEARKAEMNGMQGNFSFGMVEYR